MTTLSGTSLVLPRAHAGPLASLADPTSTASASWQRAYSRRLARLDGVVLLAAAGSAVAVAGPRANGQLTGLPYAAVAVAIALAWWVALALGRSYETRFLHRGIEEFRRVATASLHVSALVSLVAYVGQLPLSRLFVAMLLAGGTAALLVGRQVSRRQLRAGRRKGRYVQRVLVLGGTASVRDLADRLAGDPGSGLLVVGACVPGGRASRQPMPGNVPVLGSLSTVAAAVRASRADVVAVTAGPGLGVQSLRHLSYELEGSGVELLVSPTLTNISGNRVSIRPVAGLPLLHLDEPELGGARRLVKTAFDRGMSLLALLLIAPLLGALAVAVRLSSPGPAFFRQERVGRDGSTFRLWKLRTMVADAEARKRELMHLNEHDGVLFKLRADPRITPLGSVLRRWSLDELPQLLNVLLGQMSLVGPRPPLPDEVERYAGHTARRLLVKPGITGLWQVSGRSDLSWDDTVRLDLQYVEGWSLGLDVLILAKTVGTVLRSRGAY